MLVQIMQLFGFEMDEGSFAWKNDTSSSKLGVTRFARIGDFFIILIIIRKLPNKVLTAILLTIP
jgi:hypothetical protein